MADAKRPQDLPDNANDPNGGAAERWAAKRDQQEAAADKALPSRVVNAVGRLGAKAASKAGEALKQYSDAMPAPEEQPMMKKGGKISKAMKFRKGGKTSSASSRADGIAVKGKTRGKYL